MPLQQRTANVIWEGDLRGTGTVTVGTGALPMFPVTFASRAESANGKTSPEELIAAAHASCYAMAFSNTLAKAGHTPQMLDVRAVCSLDRVDGGLAITGMELTVRGKVTGINAAQFNELAQDAGKNCPVSKALRNNVPITVNTSLES